MALGLTAALITLPASAHRAPDSVDGLPLLKDVAADAVQISPHVPNMGTHWARKSDLPVGPIYCVIEGHVVCVEYMFTMQDLEAGTDWTRLGPGIETPPISHIDMEFKPNGIEGAPVPLYQLHVYFASKKLLDQH